MCSDKKALRVFHEVRNRAKTKVIPCARAYGERVECTDSGFQVRIRFRAPGFRRLFPNQAPRECLIFV